MRDLAPDPPRLPPPSNPWEVRQFELAKMNPPAPGAWKAWLLDYLGQEELKDPILREFVRYEDWNHSEGIRPHSSHVLARRLKRADGPTTAALHLLLYIVQYPGITVTELVHESQLHPTQIDRYLDRLGSNIHATRVGNHVHLHSLAPFSPLLNDEERLTHAYFKNDETMDIILFFLTVFAAGGPTAFLSAENIHRWSGRTRYTATRRVLDELVKRGVVEHGQAGTKWEGLWRLSSPHCYLAYRLVWEGRPWAPHLEPGLEGGRAQFCLEAHGNDPWRVPESYAPPGRHTGWLQEGGRQLVQYILRQPYGSLAQLHELWVNPWWRVPEDWRLAWFREFGNENPLGRA